MSSQIPVAFATPTHHIPAGPTDPSLAKLPSPFTVIVVGGSRNIGLGIAKSYAIAGASGIIISGRSQASLSAAVKEVTSLNPDTKVVSHTGDVTSEADVKSLAAFAASQFGRLDVLVINAGTSTALIETPFGKKDWPSNLTQGSYSDYMRVMNLNINAPWLLMHHILPLLEKTKDGMQTVIQLSSAASFYMNPNMMSSTYSLSKFACTRLVEHCHAGHHGNGVCVYALQPGGVMTDMAQDLPEGKGWEKALIDDVMLAGGFCVWLAKEKRDWLSGRYVDSRWDIEELERKRDEILAKDLLKLRLTM